MINNDYSSGTGTLAAGTMATKSDYLTGVPKDQLIEELDNKVRQSFMVSSIMAHFVSPIMLKNTQSYSFKQYGGADMHQVTPGVKPSITGRQTVKRTVYVEFQLISRQAIAEIEDIQSDVVMQGKITHEQGILFAKLYDTAHFIQAIKGSAMGAVVETNGAIGAGTQISITDVEAEDPDAVLGAIDEIVEKWITEDKPLDPSYRLWVKPHVYTVLLNHPRLYNADYTTIPNGDFGTRKLKLVNGIPIEQTARIPSAATSASALLLGTRFEISADEAKTLIVMMNSQSLITVVNQAQQTDYWEDKQTLSHYIDTKAAYTVDIDRQDTIAIVTTAVIT